MFHPVREKTHRLPREAYRGTVIVAFTACVLNRREPFQDAMIVQSCLAKLEKAGQKNGCRVLIYCFMPDHVHLITEGTTDNADAWRTMVDFKQQTGFWFGQSRPTFEWQKDFYDHVIRANDDLGSQIRYVAENPVRRGLVKWWSDYPFTGSIGFDLRDVLAVTSTM